MVEVKMTDDIRKFETHFMGRMTIRQTICLVLGVFLGYLLQAAICSFITVEDWMARAYIGTFIGLPIIMCGWIKPHGLRFEIYVSRVIYRLICPRRRLYKSQDCKQILKMIRQNEENEKVRKMTKKEQKKYQKEKKMVYSKKDEYKIYK